MEQAKKEPVFILTPEHNPTKEFPVPAILMRHSHIMQKAIEDFPEQEEFKYTIAGTHSGDILNLVGCLVKIEEKNNIPKNVKNEERRRNVKHSLYVGLKEFEPIELINLARIIEPLDIPDTSLCKYLMYHLAGAIRENKAHDRSIFTQLLEPWFIKAMQWTSRIMKLDTTLIQSYVDSLQPAYSLPQLQKPTEKLFNSFPFQGIFSPNIFVQCHYYNHATQTIITSELEHKKDTFGDDSDQIKRICITKNGPNGPIKYAISLDHIEQINLIEANPKETVFIFHIKANWQNSSFKTFVIKLKKNGDSNIHTVSPIYRFTEQKNLLYTANGAHFGIINVSTGAYKAIKLPNKYDITDICHNKDHSILLVYTPSEIFIGKKDNDNNFIFEELDLSTIKKKLAITDYHFIDNICLHPSQNLFYLKSFISNCNNFYRIDFSTSKIIYNSKYNIPNLFRLSHEVCFLSDDILFLGSGYDADYFLNFSTGNFWTKKKENRRIGLTADYMHSIEIKSVYNEGRTTHSVCLSRLIDENILKTTQLLNGGKFPLLLLDIMDSQSTIVPLTEPQYAEYAHFNENLKTVLSISKTITKQSRKAYYLALLKQMYPKIKHYFSLAAIFTICMATGYAMTQLENYYVPEVKFDSSDREFFWKTTSNLIRFIMYLYSN